jgi:hypothetical protein
VQDALQLNDEYRTWGLPYGRRSRAKLRQLLAKHVYTTPLVVVRVYEWESGYADF